MRSRCRLFPRRIRLFAGTTNPIIRSLLSGRSNIQCFWPQPHQIQLGVPKPPVFSCMRVFLVPNAVCCVYFSWNQAKHISSRLFVILVQYYSEDHVFAGALSLVFAWITSQPCIRHVYCCAYTTNKLDAGTAYTCNLFGRAPKPSVWTSRQWLGRRGPF